MKQGKVELYIHETLDTKGAMLFALIDPVDYRTEKDAVATAESAANGGADIILIGGSTEAQGELLDTVTKGIKEKIDLPVVLFPGNISSITRHADAIYFMSLLNARNPYWITQAQMLAAPVIKKFGVEPLPVGYIVIHPGGTVGWVGDANFIPREKPKIAAYLAMAGEFLGNRFIFTDTGANPALQNSGPIPAEMIQEVRKSITVPYIVGGGMRTPAAIATAYRAGADITVVGTAFDLDPQGAYRHMQAFSKAVRDEGKKKLK